MLVTEDTPPTPGSVPTAQELASYLGTKVAVTHSGMNFFAKVTDARIRFGHLDLLLSPTAGSGQAWTQADTVRIV